MTLYEASLFVHIVAVAVWVGGSIMLGFISSRVERTGDAQYRPRFATSAGVVGSGGRSSTLSWRETMARLVAAVEPALKT
jgi:hypothetical protein